MHDWFYHIVINLALAVFGLRLLCTINKILCYKLSRKLLKLRSIINALFMLFEVYSISILSFDIIQMFCEVTTLVELYTLIIVVIIVGEGNTIWRVE